MKSWNCPEYAFIKEKDTDVYCGVCGGWVCDTWAARCKMYQATLNGKTVDQVRDDVFREGFYGLPYGVGRY